MSKEIISKTKRISDILAKLEEGPITLKELHGLLKVSLRTLQRDIGLILNTDMPVSFKKNGTYAFINDFSLDRAGLTPQKAAMLIISNSIIDNKNIKEEFAHLKAGINKAFYPVSLNSYKLTEEEISSHSILLLLSKSIKEHKVIRVTFKDTKKNMNIRPYILVCINGLAYVIHISAGGSICKFLVSNIKSVSFRTKPEEDFLPKIKSLEDFYATPDAKTYIKTHKIERQTGERTFKPHKMMEWKILSYIEAK